MASYRPLWQTISAGIQNGNFAIYKQTGENTGLVYRGYAVRNPGTGGGGAPRVYVNLNDILYSFMDKVTLPALREAGKFNAVNFTNEFRVYDISGATQTLRADIYVINDWSYDYDYNYETQTKSLSCPINNRIQPGQHLIYSVVNARNVILRVKKKDGSESMESLFSGTADFNDDFNTDFARTNNMGSGIIVLDVSDYADADMLTIESSVQSTQEGLVKFTETYRVVNPCARYAIYYMNAYGGWDSFLLEGMCTESDQLTRHTSKRSYDVRYPETRSTVNFCNEILNEWPLRSGWLSDESAERMHHLLNTTDAYLYDMRYGLLYSVVLTSTETEYKTYRSQGCRLVQYEFTAQFAQERQRR